MQFELAEPTKVKFTDVEVLSSKDRKPNENPGAALNVSMVVSNHMLVMFANRMKGDLYMAVPDGERVKMPPEQAQGDLVPPAKVSNAAIVSDMPKLTQMGIGLGEFEWELEGAGYTLVVEYGASGTSNIVLPGCTVNKFKIKCQEGGSVPIKYRIEAPDVDGATHGKLAMLKNCEAVITLTAPEVEGQEAELSNPLPFDADEPDTPEAAFARTGLQA